MITPCILRSKRWASRLALCGGLLMALSVQPGAQAVQHVQVTIKDFTFITNQVPLQLSVPTLITIRNEDQVRHNFGSSVFQRSSNPLHHRASGEVRVQMLHSSRHEGRTFAAERRRGLRPAERCQEARSG